MKNSMLAVAKPVRPSLNNSAIKIKIIQLTKYFINFLNFMYYEKNIIFYFSVACSK